jgi:prepilin peptidase CpaA
MNVAPLGLAFVEPTRLQWGLPIGASLAAAVLDWRLRRVPNALSLLLFASGLAVAALVGEGEGFLSALAAALLMGLPLVLMWLFGASGAGDAKLMGAVGAWIGWEAAVIAMPAVLIAGAGVGLCWAAVRGQMSNVARNLFAGGMAHAGGGAAGSPAQAHLTRFPYGAAVFVGLLFACWWRLG